MKLKRGTIKVARVDGGFDDHPGLLGKYLGITQVD
jgi:hypothetical protein